MNGLAIFDVDGTLCRSSDVDDRCWIESAREVLSLPKIDTDWSCYEHSTDEAIASQLVREGTKLRPVDDYVRKIRDAFVRRVRAEVDRDPGVSRPLDGAVDIFDRLRSHQWSVAIATGGWRLTANLKLKTAGVPYLDVPAAHADDAHPRESIVKTALERAQSHGRTTFDRIVYIGDGVWDVRAARKLGIGFLGIASGERAAMLRAEGAIRILSGFDPFSAVLEALGAITGSPGNGSR